ncbi:nuclear protein DGCR14 [Tirmania nivea]|nr:nuclear protein DGCR14 [Tirmania nivea]
MASSPLPSSPSPSSQALIRKAADTELMPPPPPIKRIKRPPVVLDEDTYTDALSEIIARDFFPGLVEAKLTQEYMEALDSQDPEWIAEAGRKLNTSMISNFREQQKRMAKRRAGTGTSFAPTPTPGSVRSAETTMSTASTLGAGPRKVKPDTSLSLDAFQAKYTSEDNASFNDILDRQNEKKRNAYAWMWNGNKIPGKRVQMANRILKEREEAHGDSGGGGEQRKSIGWVDDRKAAPETWKSKPRNGFMFVPEGVEDQQLALPSPPTAPASGGEEKAQIKPPKSISYSNTRLPPPPSATASREPPPSPSFSAIQDAIAGNLRGSVSSVLEDGSATPRVNGYAFVDDEPTKHEIDVFEQGFTSGGGLPITPSFTGPSPFKIAATPRREMLLNKMVDKVAKEKRASTVLGNVAKAVGGAAGTPRGQMAPLTPAAHKLMSRMGSSREVGGLRLDSPFGEGLGKVGGSVVASRKVGAATPRMGTPAGLKRVGVKATPKK